MSSACGQQALGELCRVLRPPVVAARRTMRPARTPQKPTHYLPHLIALHKGFLLRYYLAVEVRLAP